jgi:AraC family transcriptional regulator, regulatory protein of adaptative response / methylated-DNA-[protein]-cysteine methyltransferase
MSVQHHAELSTTHVPRDAWRAVVNRDAAFDGRFVYGVSSTHIFCRPSCPSRRPRRDRVEFFSGPAAAERAGFRACKRCRPASTEASRLAIAIARVIAFLEACIDQRVTLSTLAAEVGMSPHHLQRAFARTVGISPREYHDALRRKYFTERLRAGDTVSRATYEAGYGSSSRVYGRREVRAGMTPATLRHGAVGQEITFTVAASPLGRLLVAFTATGVCAVALGDSDDVLERALRADFPRAVIHRAPAGANAWVASIVDHLRGKSSSVAVPLDVAGTAFQWMVWKALQRIPVGQTRSYGEIAQQIGRPSASRAVARACAGNPVAIVIPCHRVVRTSGEVGGYKWGVERKQQILARERAAGSR